MRFVTVNAADESVAGGLAPDCAVEDEWRRPLGDPDDPPSAAAYALALGGACPEAVPAASEARGRPGAGADLGRAAGRGRQQPLDRGGRAQLILQRDVAAQRRGPRAHRRAGLGRRAQHRAHARQQTLPAKRGDELEPVDPGHPQIDQQQAHPRRHAAGSRASHVEPAVASVSGEPRSRRRIRVSTSASSSTARTCAFAGAGSSGGVSMRCIPREWSLSGTARRARRAT